MTRLLKAFVRLVVIGLLSISLGGTPARADCEEPGPYAILTMGPDPWTCPAGGFVSNLSVWVAVSRPLGKVRFTLPDPYFATIFGETWLPHAGNRQTGMEFDLDCTSELTWLGSLTMFVSTSALVTWPAQNVEVEDCEGNVHGASLVGQFNGGYCYFQFCGILQPYSLFPPDGATGVSDDVELTWHGDGGSYCWVSIGTQPDCSDAVTIQVPCDQHSFEPTVSPGTTYYWSVGLMAESCNDSPNSGVHSFTTTGPVATKAVTWGQVKAIYRE